MLRTQTSYCSMFLFEALHCTLLECAHVLERKDGLEKMLALHACPGDWVRRRFSSGLRSCSPSRSRLPPAARSSRR